MQQNMPKRIAQKHPEKAPSLVFLGLRIDRGVLPKHLPPKNAIVSVKNTQLKAINTKGLEIVCNTKTKGKLNPAIKPMRSIKKNENSANKIRLKDISITAKIKGRKHKINLKNKWR